MTTTPTTAPYPGVYTAVRDVAPGSLGYEHAPITSGPWDNSSYITEIAQAREQLKETRLDLMKIVEEPVPATRAEGHMRLITGLDDNRKRLEPFMQHDVTAPSFPRNETPRFNVDGSMFADDLVNPRMQKEGSVAMRLENILYRMPAESVEKQNWQALADAHTMAREVTRKLAWQGAERPDVPKALSMIDQMTIKLQNAMDGQGAPSEETRSWIDRSLTKFKKLPTAGKAAVVGTALVGVVGAALVLNHTFGDKDN